MSDYMQGNRDDAVAVPFSDDDKEKDSKEDLLEDAPETASAEERATRKQKRQERLTRLLHEGNQSKEEVKALREELATLRTETARLQGAISVLPRPGESNDGKDQFDRELDQVYARQGAAYNAAQAEIKAGSFNEERSRYYEAVAREIETEKARIHTRRELAQREPSRRQEQAQQVWVQKYPEVYGNQQAYQYAEATFRRRQALGETVNNGLVDEVMNETMAQFRLGPKKAPTQSERARHTGMPSSGSGGGSGRSEGLSMTPELRRMAVAAYSDLSEADAIKKWTNGPGKRLREKKIL